MEKHLTSDIQLIFFFWSFSNHCTQAVAKRIRPLFGHTLRSMNQLYKHTARTLQGTLCWFQSLFLLCPQLNKVFSGNSRDLSVLNSKMVSLIPPQKKLQFHFSVGSTNFMQLQGEEKRHSYKIMPTCFLLQNIRQNVIISKYTWQRVYFNSLAFL